MSSFAARRLALFGSCLVLLAEPSLAQQVPPALQDWKDWATWSETRADSRPSRHDDAGQKMPLWYSALEIEAGAQGAHFSFSVEARGPGLAMLPGDANCWPQEVRVEGQAVPVLGHPDHPCVALPAGSGAEIQGIFRWSEMPQSLRVPDAVGILRLKLNEQEVELPVRDEENRLWLQRTGTEPADRDFLSAKVYRLIEDSSPQWLRTQVELSVAGKSREEALGHALPQGWQLSWVESPLPCAVDDAGRLKVQVRAGRWVVKLSAFRTQPASTVAYAEKTQPLAAEEWVGLQQDTALRVVELDGIPAVDVAQTTYPEEWRQYPVHLWTTAQPFQIVEKMRGMGSRKPPGITLQRSFWLDEEGGGLTYRDQLSGRGQQTWRLDAAERHQLGAVKIAGQGQLITKNPATGAVGVEVRDRNLDLQAVGRLEGRGPIPATGWQMDAESLNAELQLPPGWRLLAVFGPDWSQGDWLTDWTLLDVFMLLISTLALWRLWGWKTALLGLLAFLLSYQELGAPRLCGWLLIAGMAAAKLLQGRVAEKWALLFRSAALAIFALGSLTFFLQQVQQALYPQLEVGVNPGLIDENERVNASTLASTAGVDAVAGSPVPATESMSRLRKVMSPLESYAVSSPKPGLSAQITSNLLQDAKARIQTGPAVPQWTWRSVSFGWRGPVAAGEHISLWLIPCSVERVLSVLRVAFLLALAWLLARPSGGKRGPRPSLGAALHPAVLLLCFAASDSAHGQTETPAPERVAPPSGQALPTPEMLDVLRQRLREDAETLRTQNRAELPHVRLQLQGRKLTMEAEIHASALVAVPLPGRLPSWSPIQLEGGLPSLRHEDYLWVLVAPGVSHVKVTGLLPPGPEWQWSFLLKPRQVSIDAPGWTVTGLKPQGVPENQVFFVEQNRSTGAEAAYDQKNYQPVVRIEREIELGLVWQVRTRVQRLSQTGKAVSLSLPLLPGERVMSPGMTASAGRIEVRLGVSDTETSWQGELTPTERLELKADANPAGWVEHWTLHTSPVWHVQVQGLEPIYETTMTELMPVWRPWPGETTTLAVTRPEAVQGTTTTVLSAQQTTQLGDRHHTTRLTLEVQASLGEDFRVQLPEGAEISSLIVGGREQPVRKEKSTIVIPVQPGDQRLELIWKTLAPMGLLTRPDPVLLPVPASNIQLEVSLPASRWLLWAGGPQRGPAVRFWGMALVAVLVGVLLARLPRSPLRSHEWALLTLGFLQLHWIIGTAVVLWFLLMAWRGFPGGLLQQLPRHQHNLMQVILLGGSGIVLLCMLAVVNEGLLGRPDMLVSGNGSTSFLLRWFQDRMTDGTLPQPLIFTTSIWVYRALMLLWSLWLAYSILRWIPWSWQQLSAGHFWKKAPPPTAAVPPPLP